MRGADAGGASRRTKRKQAAVAGVAQARALAHRRAATWASTRRTRTARAPSALLAQYADRNARLAAAEASVRSAQLDVGYCRVTAPFDAYVTNLNTAVGEYARQGQQIFALVDDRAWYVLANFRETYMDAIRPGMAADVYLMELSRVIAFRGIVQGIGWANRPDEGATVGILPNISRTLNWVRLANRFPVRILLEDRDAERPFRMGTTAVVTIRGFPGRVAPGAPAR